MIGCLKQANVRELWWDHQMLSFKKKYHWGLVLALLAERLRRHDDNVVEHLFGEIPVLCGGAAANIAGREQRGREHPRVIENEAAFERAKRCGHISSPAYPTQPVPPGTEIVGVVREMVKRFR